MERAQADREAARYMHRNPVNRGRLLEPEQWQRSSYRSYAYQEEGRVKINQWPKAVMKVRAVAYLESQGSTAGAPRPLHKTAKPGPPACLSPGFPKPMKFE